MFESIIKQSLVADYDFRHTANPHDPLKNLFDHWVDYYKVKWAIAHVLKPASILEVGVRYGYSAAAFLHGHPNARYIGIDLDTDSYGGVKGAINWAKEITRQFSAEFIIADTQAMNCLPGDIYDLVHVDGQQDGDGYFHDLELAIKQARYVLVDGYLWTRINFMAVNEFLFRYHDLLDFYGVIPGYARELLIKVSPDYLKQTHEEQHQPINSSLDIRQTYTTEYYLQDCGGFDGYKKSRGKSLEDARLRAVAAIASLKNQGRVLELGCGRGELTYHFAKQGFEITAVDYSQSAIELAQRCFNGEEHLKTNVQFCQDDVCAVLLNGQYDLVISSDVIEHLSFDELDLLYRRVSQHLKPDGLFVLHTFPNLWLYQYEYPRKRRIAASVGAYLPAQPRTRYEMLMHINEQSPRVLKRQLGKYFKHVLIWFADIYNKEVFNPGGSLVEQYNKQKMRAAPDLFAIASHHPIDQDEVKAHLQITPLPPIPSGELALSVKAYPSKVSIKNEFNVAVEITNNSSFVLGTLPPNPVYIACHWMDEEATTMIIHDGERSDIFPPLNPRAKGSYIATMTAPRERGCYILRVTLVQEFVRWFDQTPTMLAEDISIAVS